MQRLPYNEVLPKYDAALEECWALHTKWCGFCADYAKACDAVYARYLDGTGWTAGEIKKKVYQAICAEGPPERFTNGR